MKFVITMEKITFVLAILGIMANSIAAIVWSIKGYYFITPVFGVGITCGFFSIFILYSDIMKGK